MEMPSKQELLKSIFRYWEEKTPQYKVSSLLIDYLERTDAGELSHISHGSLFKILGQDYDPEVVLEVFQYLAGSQLNLFEIKFEFIDDDDEVYSIKKSDLAEARRLGLFAHPHTGNPVADFEEKVFFYYQPVPRTLEVLKHGS